ncbi:MAG: sulfite exporter TauE/SafE family protein [Desulfovibrionaceae bacterium]
MQDSLFLVAVQSALILGLVHGVNPCGHSWLALAPFVSGERSGKRVLLLTSSFLGGTALACLLIGLSLGAISAAIPPRFSDWMEMLASGAVIVFGLILLIRPHLLHSHEHDHEHGHDHHDHHDHAHHGHDACACSAHPGLKSRINKAAAPGLFAFGFVNMIVPCPTAAIMYSYALNSGSAWRATAVFGAYALTTALAVGGVIWLLFRATALVRRLRSEHAEEWIMRGIGAMTVAFGVYALYVDLGA